MRAKAIDPLWNRQGAQGPLPGAGVLYPARLRHGQTIRRRVPASDHLAGDFFQVDGEFHVAAKVSPGRANCKLPTDHRKTREQSTCQRIDCRDAGKSLVCSVTSSRLFAGAVAATEAKPEFQGASPARRRAS